MARTRDPRFYRRLVGRRVRRLREERARTQPEVAAAMEWSLSKLIRLEAGAGGVSASDMKALLTEYGVTDPEQVDQFVAMARETRKRAWYDRFASVLNTPVSNLFSYESAATAIRQAHPLLVPGPAQTPRYTRSLLAQYFSGAELDLAEEARRERLRRLRGADGPEMALLIDESVIRRVIGGPEVMSEQLRELRALAEDQKVTIRVIGYAAGWHAALDGPFILLDVEGDLESEVETVLFLEMLDKDFFTAGDDELVRTYQTKWDDSVRAALSEDDSLALIEEQIKLLDAR
ncbi:DUF5753 domain-containing protein [Actinokineospora iranica]|uniref:Helix-turn-helix domain-containing protein n=1 Tax=Actinokineospora iranica TaxID=1271860 RepID=A0A1G6RDS1_9PSEU|nr:DUF5753 domain-containing protein [Actinokineospora iranica]SDD02688.1 Helix-turn-helix domain-containing protein [Actinokineospora iranica]